MLILLREPKFRMASVIPSFSAGGIGTVCRYAAEGIAKVAGWEVTLLSLHDPPAHSEGSVSGVHMVSLGLKERCASSFLEWLRANPQQLLLTSDVSRIESAFPFVPAATKHVIQIHDSGRRYRDVATRHHAWIDGVTCVGIHIERLLKAELDRVRFHGLLRAVHNGARFPPMQPRKHGNGPLRVLFLGRMDAMKGVFDLAPIMRRLRDRGVAAVLQVVGGDCEPLRRQFRRAGLDNMVSWVGRVSHERCYQIAGDSDALLMLSRKEPFGMVTIEAMSMGCVPIAYDVPSGSTEIIVHGESGVLVPLGDYGACADALLVLSRDRRKLARLSAGAMERARSRFDARVMSEGLARFLSEVLAHAASWPAARKGGEPPQGKGERDVPNPAYQLLPEGLRTRIRNVALADPRLGYWLLNR